MPNRAVGPIKDEVVRHVRSTDTHICLWVVSPLIRQLDTVLARHLPVRCEAHVKTSGTHDDVEFLLPLCRLDPLLGNLLDLVEFDGHIAFLECLKITLPRGQSATTDLPFGDKLGAQLWVLFEPFLH